MRRLAAFGLTALFVAFLVAPPAGATFPGTNGKIAYSKSSRWTRPDIFTIDPDGTGRIRLINTNKLDTQPVWSPDGLRIAFLRLDEQFILLMDADGSNVSTVLAKSDLPGVSRLADPSWSPDGTMLAFCAETATLKWKIYTVGIDGTGLTKLSGGSDNDCAPAWSPDGTTIAIESFNAEKNNGDIVLLAADGSTREALVTAGSTQAPNWSPSGAELAFTRGISTPMVSCLAAFEGACRPTSTR
jgi:Tol biopolymer transport system component